MRKPSHLVSGDRIALVAPASPFDRDRFNQGAAEIERFGLVPVITDEIFARRGYVAGDARSRAAALTDAWRDPSIAAVMAARGGYGSAQVLPFLDPDIAREASKPFIGHSDLTALLVYLTTVCETVCFHGPMVLNLSRGEAGYDRDSLRRCLMTPAPVGELRADPVETLRAGETSGPLFGGTLTQLVASLGTPYAFAPPPGYVLLLDEVGERPYRIDRMVTQLRASGVLARAAAVVCSEFPDCDESKGEPTARAVLAELLEAFSGPVLFGFPTGHTTGPALTVPLGVQVRVVGSKQPCLVVTESAVA
ncbi:MAG: LD-carboxypeptidase [Acidobacteria bacterium]|jgi:muramoyltetrapeptide carboxypeptidase|nr:LD-carboxypeptidase [Acidobacteriota bacterium]MDP7337876.1 LD-carboxypeptidase [Vicinamibacterales bacterium]MDP7479820.1 LD-carboxypeptidase [Vicinamibacterales bacterium]HJN46410.1 LD-carboxypeptidase [Vicinamibacterales bacterium]